MWMSREAVEKYPKSVKLLQTLGVYISRHNNIKDAFVKACTENLGGKLLKRATNFALQTPLKWGSEPLIVVGEGLLEVPVAGELVKACGFTSNFDRALDPKKNPKIIITSVWFDGVDYGSSADLKKNERRLRITVLHETVHWVREMMGAPDEIETSYKEPNKEPGRYFEELAFGISSICTDEEIFDSVASRLF